jgi:hypothetical protein
MPFRLADLGAWLSSGSGALVACAGFSGLPRSDCHFAFREVGRAVISSYEMLGDCYIEEQNI